MTQRRVTIADVAERAGLSKGAVSLILNERPGSRLSEDAISRVRAAAAELGYRPHPAARALRTRQSRTIALISDEVTVTRHASSMIRGVLDAAGTLDHTVLIVETGSDLANKRTAAEVVLDGRADGVVFATTQARQIDLPDLPEGTPMVLLNATAASPAACVLPDEHAAGRAVVDALVASRPQPRLVLLGVFEGDRCDPRDSSTVGDRIAGIRDGLRRHGVRPVTEIAEHYWLPERGFAAMSRLCASATRFDAVICLNDRLAFGAYQALAESGLRVPDDVAVISFDDDEIAAYLRPGLTTAAIPYVAMGNRAVTTLLGDDLRPGVQALPMPLQLRGSLPPTRGDRPDTR